MNTLAWICRDGSRGCFELASANCSQLSVNSESTYNMDLIGKSGGAGRVREFVHDLASQRRAAAGQVSKLATL
jgi:hypothetical protein